MIPAIPVGYSVTSVLRTVRGTDVRELPRTRRVALRELRAALLARQKAETDLRDLYRKRALDGAEAADTLRGARRLSLCVRREEAYPAGYPARRRSLPVSLNLSSSYISSARAAFGGKPETELFRF